MVNYYLVDCDDLSFCVIHEKSVLFTGRCKRLLVGQTIRFLWPDDDEKQEEFGGKILEISSRYF